MSVREDGKQIRCDGEGCQAVTALPVALRPQLLPPDSGTPAAEGWLFISGNGASRHFCPRCALKQLDRSVDSTDWSCYRSAQQKSHRQEETAIGEDDVPQDSHLFRWL